MFTVAQYAIDRGLTADEAVEAVLNCPHTGNYQVAEGQVHCVASIDDKQQELVAVLDIRVFGATTGQTIAGFAWGSWMENLYSRVQSKRQTELGRVHFFSGASVRESYYG